MELELGGSRPLCLAWIATHVPASKGRSHDAAAEPCRPTPFAANFNYCRTETLWGRALIAGIATLRLLLAARSPGICVPWCGMRNAGGRCRWDVEAAGFSLSAAFSLNAGAVTSLGLRVSAARSSKL